MAEKLHRYDFPSSASEFNDLSTAVEKFVLPGSVPPAPLVDKGSLIFTLGSCFARNLANRLHETGIPAGTIEMTEAINSPLANKMLLHYAVTEQPHVNEDDAEIFTKENLESLRTVIPQAKLLVFTVGVAYCMFQGGHYLPKLTARARRAGNLTVRLTSVEENATWLREATTMLRKLNPALPIVFTVSPVPLRTTFGEESIVTSDCLSKSTLILALKLFMAQRIPGTYYWPAFEVVRWLSGHTGAMYGNDDDNPRHISAATVRTIIDLFLKYYVR